MNEILKRKRELESLSIRRLFCNQKIELELLCHYIMTPKIYDKNDYFNKIQQIMMINKVINDKLNSSSFKKVNNE